jgi:hypothetical protein
MRKACIAIGVDGILDVPKLTTLKAASAGAREFVEWAQKSDPRYETFPLTD